MFGGAALEAVVQKTLAEAPDIPEGARGAFLTVTNQHGIRAVVAHKINDTWTVAAEVEQAWTTETGPTFGAVVKGTW